MATYVEIVDETLDFLVGKITEVSEDTAFVGDIDAVVDGLYDNADVQAGLVLDFLYSVPHSGDSGRRVRDLWDTFIGGLLVLQFTGRDETETDKNTLLNMLWRAFDGGSAKIISGTDKVSIIRVERPDKAELGEHPFYFLPFTLMVNHGGKE